MQPAEYRHSKYQNWGASQREFLAVAVDNELGFAYYSDEGAGIRKYNAHPDSSSTELAISGTTGLTDNREGISVYKTSLLQRGTYWSLISKANRFIVIRREGSAGNSHGLFIAMCDDKKFQIYDWEPFELQAKEGEQ